MSDADIVREALRLLLQKESTEALSALDRLVADLSASESQVDEAERRCMAAEAERDTAREAHAISCELREAAEAERDEARAERDHWSESALADRTRTAEARVAELEAALYRTRKAGNEAVDLALAVYGWAVYPRNGAELRMKADRLRAALDATKAEA